MQYRKCRFAVWHRKDTKLGSKALAGDRDDLVQIASWLQEKPMDKILLNLGREIYLGPLQVFRQIDRLVAT